jgi:uncharacterized damage-inducible protein DinB
MTVRPGDTSVLTSLFRHNLWANLRLLDFCAGLSDAQLETGMVGAYGSIRKTLLHLVRAETGYVRRSTGKAFGPPLQLDHFPGFDALKDAARWAGDELAKLALSTRTEDLIRESPPNESAVEYPVSGLLLQAINHSTEHRTQVSAIITQLGLEPPEMDGWTYMWETGEGRDVLPPTG